MNEREIKKIELQMMETNGITLGQFTRQYKMDSAMVIPAQPLEKPCLKNQITQNLRMFSNGGNTNLFAFSYMLLLTIYDDQLNQNLLSTLKSLLYDPKIILTNIKNQPLGISSNEMKKLFVEFVFQLQFRDHFNFFQRTLLKYSVILYILVIFIRTLLFQNGIEKASDYKYSISSETAYNVLSDLLDVNYRKVQNSYLFIQSHCVIYEEAQSLIFVGTFNSSKPSSFASSDNQDSQQEQYIVSSYNRKQQNFNFGSAIIRDSLMQDHDAPTPFFGETQEEKQTFNTSNPLSHVYNLGHELKVTTEVDEDQSQQSNFFQMKLSLLKGQLNGWKSPIYNNGIIEDAANSFNAFEIANQYAFIKNEEINMGNQQIKCCFTSVKQQLTLCSRIYEINLTSFNCNVKPNKQLFQCLIIKMKNIYQIQAQEAIGGTRRKIKRANTVNQAHSNQLYDIDKRDECGEQKRNEQFNRTQFIQNTTDYSQNYYSRVRILKGRTISNKIPKINFNYINRT